MKLKGDLDSIGLAELFQTLSSQRATGVLTVSSANGDKVIAIAHGEVAVLSDKLAERVRLGDLLISRGKLTETQLNDALKMQRTSEQRSRLGDVLIKQGVIKQQDITDSLRFQLEEEIYDLFTWKNANFEFDGDQSVDDAASLETKDTNLQRMSIEPQALIAEAGRRMEDWKTIEDRLPTPYLCFKLSPKGEELSGKANASTLQILKLLKEGRTIETTVKRSCMGRFNVCKIIVKLLDDGWVFPYPAGELKYLATEHRAGGRFSDALYVYRRMLEAAQTDVEKNELHGLIDDTLDAIRRAQESGASVEGAETVSYKQAAEHYKKRQYRKRILTFVVSGVGLIAATLWLTEYMRPSVGIAAIYQEAYLNAKEAERKQQYQKAVAIWQDFQKKIPRRSPTYGQVEEQIESLRLQDDAYVRNVLQRLQLLVKTDPTAAENDYKKLATELAEKNAENPHLVTIKGEMEKIQAVRLKEEGIKKAAVVKEQLQLVKDLMQQKNFSAARKLCADIANTAPAGSPEDTETQDVIKQLSAIEFRAEAAVKQGNEALAQKKGESAIAIYASASNEWPELSAAETGDRESARLAKRLEQLKQAVAGSDALAARKSYIEALERLESALTEYAEFDYATLAREKTIDLKKQLAALDARIAEARAAEKRGDAAAARKLFSELMKEYTNHLAGRSVQVPVSIVSYPAGAKISINGEDSGLTPKEISIPLNRAITVRIELAGYAPKERRIERIGFEGMEIRETLDREALLILDLKVAIMAQPRVINGRLLVLSGATLSALSPDGKDIAWTMDKLLDISAETRPHSSGVGAPVFVSDKTWWFPRWPPMPTLENTLLLPLRSRKLVEINTATKSTRLLLALPSEPIGAPFFDGRSQLAGKPLLAVACADAKIRAYDLEKPGATLWEKPIDPAAPASTAAKPDDTTFATGLCPRVGGLFIALSSKGRLACFSIINGQEIWSRDFKTLSGFSDLPTDTGENLASLVLRDGRVVLVDLNSRGESAWELPVSQPLDEATHAEVSKDGVYVVTRRGDVCKYSREKTAGKPTLLWKRALDGHCELPLHAGKYLYALSHFGTAYAIAPADGQIVWKYKVEGTPTWLSDHANLMYIATKEGKLLILSAE